MLQVIKCLWIIDVFNREDILGLTLLLKIASTTLVSNLVIYLLKEGL